MIPQNGNAERQRLLEAISPYEKYGLFELIKADISWLGSFRSALPNIGFLAVFFYRIAHFFHKHRLDWVGFFIQAISLFLFGCDISRKFVAGPGFRIEHSSGIFIGPLTKFGKKVEVNAGCFIGSLKKPNDPNDYPVLGDNVYVAPGAKVFGGVAIGERSVLGPNTVITRNIPPDHTALPQHVRVIKKYK